MKYVGYFLLGLLILFGIFIGFNMLNTATTVATAPGKIIQKTLQTDNIIQNYEWFHDVYTAQQARVNQITQFNGFLETEENAKEKRSLRMEMAAQQMSCRDLVAKYNANSEKMNVGVFRDWSLPNRLEEYTCEVS